MLSKLASEGYVIEHPCHGRESSYSITDKGREMASSWFATDGEGLEFKSLEYWTNPIIGNF